jgi:dipicolinate synthase subunit B
MLSGIKVGLVLTGSFCTFAKAFTLCADMIGLGADVTAVMSENAATTDTRFGTARDNIAKFAELTGRAVIRTIPEAEPIGPKGMFDVIVVAPCTGNTAAKLAASIVDTTATMAVKSHLRGGKPVILAICTNDFDSGAAKNIGILRNLKAYTIVKSYHDDTANKPFSQVADFAEIVPTIVRTLNR